MEGDSSVWQVKPACSNEGRLEGDAGMREGCGKLVPTMRWSRKTRPVVNDWRRTWSAANFRPLKQAIEADLVRSRRAISIEEQIAVGLHVLNYPSKVRMHSLRMRLTLRMINDRLSFDCQQATKQDWTIYYSGRVNSTGWLKTNYLTEVLLYLID